MARINWHIHSPPVTPISSILLPPVPCSQLAMCQKECSVCYTNPTAGHVSQLPSETEVADVLTMTCRYKKFCFYLQCRLKETFLVNFYTVLFLFSPEQRSWYTEREYSSEVFLKEGSDTMTVRISRAGRFEGSELRSGVGASLLVAFVLIS